MNNTESSNSNPNRRVQRTYHCYGCQNEWRQLVNPSDLNGVQCPACASEFFEETQSYEQQVRQVSVDSQPQVQAPQPRVQNMQQLPVRQETTQVLPNGGWTRSVTISYGNGSSEPQVTSINMGSGSQRAPQAADHFMDEFNSRSNFFSGQQEGGAPADLLEAMFRQHSPLAGFMQSGFVQRQGQQRPQSHGCSSDFIANLPQKEEGKESDCYICLEKCSEGETSCQLPCNHAFDRGCIENWLKENDTCPVCRTKLDEANASNRRAPESNQHERHQASAPQLNNFFFF